MTFEPPGAFPVEVLPDGRVRTTATVRWVGHHGDAVEIAAGTVSDGATRPWFTGAIVDEWGPATRAFLVHDVLCDALNRWRADVARWRGIEAPWVVAPPFDAVDTDAVLRLVLRELGTGPVLARVYWVGVRWGALGNAHRRGGWWRTLPGVLAWSPVALAVLLPATVGALVSRGLLAVCEALAWPFTGRRPHAVVARRRPLARQPAASGPVPCPYRLFACAGDLGHPGEHVPAQLGTPSGCTCRYEEYAPGVHAPACPVAPPLRGSALARAERGVSPAVVEVFRAGWRACHAEMTAHAFAHAEAVLARIPEEPARTVSRCTCGPVLSGTGRHHPWCPVSKSSEPLRGTGETRPGPVDPPRPGRHRPVG